MPALRYLLPVLLLSLLSACGSGEQDEAVPHKESEPAVVQAEPAPQTPAKSPVVEPAPPASVEPKASPIKPPAPSQSKPPAAPAVQKTAETTPKAAPRTKLDLSLPAELAAQLDAEDHALEDGLQPLLPAFFEEKKPSLNPFQVSGKLITGQEGADYWDSVEGAELHFEFRR